MIDSDQQLDEIKEKNNLKSMPVSSEKQTVVCDGLSQSFGLARSGCGYIGTFLCRYKSAERRVDKIHGVNVVTNIVVLGCGFT